MIIKKLGIALCALFLVEAALADTATGSNWCMNPHNLLPKWDMAGYQACQQQIQQCPKQGNFIQADCVSKLSQQASMCRPLNQVAEILQTSMDTVTAEKFSLLTLFTQHFGADGQQRYYVLTPAGCLIDPLIDTQTASKILGRADEGKDLMIVTSGAADYQVQPEGSARLVVHFKVNKGCLACETLGMVTETLWFDSLGELQKKTYALVQERG